MRTPAALPAPAVPARPKSAPAAGAPVVVAVSAVAGFLGMKMLLGTGMLGARIAGGMAAGLLVGLIPFFVARKRDPKFAQTALAWCVAAGAVLGIVLAAPVAFGLTLAAATRRPAA